MSGSKDFRCDTKSRWDYATKCMPRTLKYNSMHIISIRMSLSQEYAIDYILLQLSFWNIIIIYLLISGHSLSDLQSGVLKTFIMGAANYFDLTTLNYVVRRNSLGWFIHWNHGSYIFCSNWVSNRENRHKISQTSTCLNDSLPEKDWGYKTSY